MRLPPEPSPPPGDSKSIKIFRAGKNYLTLKMLHWATLQLMGLVMLAAPETIFALTYPGKLPSLAVEGFRALWLFGALVFLAQLPFSYLAVRLDYELRWYIVTDRSLRLRYGLQRVREITMTFANIQQITVHQGPIQRLFGIADLKVQSAGGGGGEDSHHPAAAMMEQMHIAHFRGVDNASEIRNLILERLRQWRDSGLGDPEDVSGTPTLVMTGTSESGESPVLGAARLLLQEATRLRQSLTSFR